MSTDAPRNAIVTDLAAALDAALKAEWPGAWCTDNCSEDPDKVDPAQTPMVVLWQGQELGPDQEPMSPLDRCFLEIKALIWIKNKQDALEVQQELNRVIWCLKRALYAITEAGGLQVTVLRRGSAIETNIGDTLGDGWYRFFLFYDVEVEP